MLRLLRAGRLASTSDANHGPHGATSARKASNTCRKPVSAVLRLCAATRERFDYRLTRTCQGTMLPLRQGKAPSWIHDTSVPGSSPGAATARER